MTNPQRLWLPPRLDHLAEFSPTVSRQLDRLYDDLNGEADPGDFRRHLDALAWSLDDSAGAVLDEQDMSWLREEF